MLNQGVGLLNQNTSALSFLNTEAHQQRRCIQEIKDRKQIFIPLNNKNQESFTFDFVGAEEVSQDEIFQVVGKPIVDQCLQGYNGSIFAYGQTGSGKTYTIQGAGSYLEKTNEESARTSNVLIDENEMHIDQSNKKLQQIDKSQRGLLPRCFEYLFQQICKIKNQHNLNSARGKRSARSSFVGSANLPKFDENCTDIQFDVKCSYLEIYNENIIDLLDNTQNKVQIREEKERGVFADPCTEEKVTCIQEVMKIIGKGACNRKIASTNMNRESSRSHAVFTAIIKTIQTLASDEQIIKTARFHIVDLAGSERCKETGAEGMRLKEASMINKSLTTLGAVINDLADFGSNENLTKGKTRHIRYRESKLTYLLRDALGGNSKTVMICNVNPHLQALKETRSTLQFAHRAKMIKNEAVVNEENTSANYWKDRYMREVGLTRANTVPNPSLENNLQIGQGICSNCVVIGNGPNINKGGEKTKEKMLLEGQKHIQALAQQLKEEVDKNTMMRATFDNAIEDTQKYKNQMKLQLKLKENQLKKLIEDRQQTPPLPEIQVLLNQIQDYKQEVDMMKQRLDANPLLAAKAAKIKELELQVNEYKSMVEQKIGNRGVQQTLQEVMEYVSKAILYLEQSISSKKDRNETRHLDNNLGGDVDMENTLNRTILNQQQISADYSSLTVKRSEELTNIKVQYEDQLETLRNQLKLEMQKNLKLHSFITQKCSQATNMQDELLLNSSQTFNNVIFNTQNLLNSQRSQLFNQSQIINAEQKQWQKQLQQPIPFLSLEARLNEQESEDLISLINECQIELGNKDAQINLLKNENDQQRDLVSELTSKYDQAVKDKIDLESIKIQIEDQLDNLNHQLAGLTAENEELYEQVEQIESMKEVNQEYSSKVAAQEEEIMNLQNTHDYFVNNVIPELQQSYQQLKNKFSELEQENKSMGEMKNRNQDAEELQRQISKLTSLCNAKESQLQELNTKLIQTLKFVEEQDQYTTQLNQKVHELTNQLSQHKSILDDVTSDRNRLKQQIGDLEQILENSTLGLKNQERQISDLKQKLVEKDRVHVQEVQKYEETLKVMRSDREQLETQYRLIQEQIELQKQSNSSLQSQLTESHKKFETYRTLFDQSMVHHERALESVKKCRSSQQQRQSQVDGAISKLKDENKELKDVLRDKNQQVSVLEIKMRQLEVFRDKMAEKDTEIHRMRNLERENVSLRGELELYKTQVGQLESQLQIKEVTFSDLQTRYENLDKQNGMLLGVSNQSKFTHINKIKQQNNQDIQKLHELQGDLVKRSQELRKIEFRLSEWGKWINQFGEMVYKTLKVNKGNVKLRWEEYGGHVQEYLNSIHELIMQAFTNQKLQLETPINLPESKQSESISSSCSEMSSSVEDSRLDRFNMQTFEFYNPPQLQKQQQHQPLQNRRIVLNSGNTAASLQDQENINYSNQMPLSSTNVSQTNNFKIPTFAFKVQHQINPQSSTHQASQKQGLVISNSTFNINPSIPLLKSGPTTTTYASAATSGGFTMGQTKDGNNGCSGGTALNTSAAKANGNRGGQTRGSWNQGSGQSNGESFGNGRNQVREPSNQRMDIDS